MQADGSVAYDGNLAPYQVDVDKLTADTVSGVLGMDWGSEKTPFEECHACAHIYEDYTATWSSELGRYLLSHSKAEPTAYVTLMRYLQSYDDKGDQFLDRSADIAKLHRFRDSLNEAFAHVTCRIGEDPSVNATKATTATLDITCDNDDSAPVTLSVNFLKHKALRELRWLS